MGFYGGAQGVDVLLGGVLAEADAEGAGGFLFGKAQGGDDVAGLSPVAGAAGGDADALGAQVLHQILAGIARQGAAENVGRFRRAQQLQTGDGQQPLAGVSLHGGGVGEDIRKAGRPLPDGFGKARDPGGGLRAGAQAARLAAAISRAGGEPFTACELELSPLPASNKLGIDRYCIVFTSVYGVELYFSRLLASGRDARCLAGKALACVGRSTARALAAHGLSADIVPGGGTTAALADALLAALPAGAGIFLYRSAAADGSLAAALGAQFDVCDNRAYAARAGAYQAPRALIEGAAAFAFTSAHGAALALAALSPLPEGAVLAALGGPTARALAGLPGLVVAERPEAEALADAIIRAIKNAPAVRGRA